MFPAKYRGIMAEDFDIYRHGGHKKPAEAGLMIICFS